MFVPVERVEQLVDVEHKACACCGDSLYAIGEERPTKA